MLLKKIKDEKRNKSGIKKMKVTHKFRELINDLIWYI